MSKLLTEPRPARVEDLPKIVNLIEEASDWLRTKDTDQWAKPWPSRRKRDKRVLEGLRSGATWMVWDGAIPVATITSQRAGDARLWTPEELAQPAVYLHRLVINRGYAGHGTGAALIDWAIRRAAAEYGARHARIDVWATNGALHDYYKGNDFRFLRNATGYPGYPSSALFERSAWNEADDHVVLH